MPISVTETAGGVVYGSPFVGSPGPVAHMKLDVSTLLIDGTQGAQVDSKGYLKPGSLFKVPSTVGVPLDGTSGEFVYGVVPEAIKIVAENPTNTTLGADTSDPFIGVVTGGLLNRDIIEDNLGRALHANEIAALKAAGSQFTLTVT